MKHNKIYLLWMALTVLALHSGQIRAQVTIGSNVTPDANSLLDLKNQKGEDRGGECTHRLRGRPEGTAGKLYECGERGEQQSAQLQEAV